MKKTWILTPLLLGVAIWGCSAQPQTALDSAPGQEAPNASSSSAQVVDKELLTQPLEEAESVVEIEELADDSLATPPVRMVRAKDSPVSDLKFQSGVAPQEGDGAAPAMMGGAYGDPSSGPGGYGGAGGYGAGGYGGGGYAPGADAGGMGGGGGYDVGGSGMGGGYPGGAPSDEYGVQGIDAGYGGGYGEAAKKAMAPLAEMPVNESRQQQGQGQAEAFRRGATETASESKQDNRGFGIAPLNEPMQVAPLPAVSNPVPAAAEPLSRTRRNLAKSESDFENHPFDPNAPARDDLAGQKPSDGVGPGEGGDKFEPIEENNFIAVADQPLSTFSIDVDTASYSKIRSYLSQFNQLPPRDAVRVEELVNYFQYDYAQPTDEHPFAANVEVASCPWNPTHRLVRVGIKGKEVDTQERPASNIVFLLDVSGSMNSTNKLPLLKKGMKMLVDQLGENDKVSIVVYAGAAGMVLEPTYGYDKATILSALDRLQAGGSTNGGQGIQLAYKTATENFIQGGTNRVILCTDGDFNVGETSTGGLVEMAAEQAKKNIYLSILGFGIGNHNDSMLEQLSNKANGNYAFIDNDKEAQKVLVEQMSGTLLTIAKDVKIQIEFNPKKVASYRLVGYENRILAAQDFNDDKKDAGEIGAGHTVTAFYEIVPATGKEELAAAEPMVDELKYQTERKPTKAAKSNELMTLKLRYKQPEEDVSTLMTYPVVDEGHKFNQSTGDFQFASAVAMFGLKLRGDRFHTDTNFAEIEELVASNVDGPGSSYRQEFLDMVRKVGTIAK